MSNAETLRELLAYDPCTGDLIWRPRAIKWFDNEREFKRWNRRYAGNVAGTFDRDGYRQIAIFYKRYRAHRIIWAMQTGAWPEDEIDHINQIKHDNRWINLRVVTSMENKRNTTRQANNKTGITGVCWAKREGKYHAQIKHNGRRVHLGTFAKLEDAAAARKAAEIRYDYHQNHGSEKRT